MTDVFKSDANPTVTLSAGDIEVGAVEGKDATTDTRVKVGAPAGVTESDNGWAVVVPVLGVTTGAKVITDAAGTAQQYLRGLIHLLISKITAYVEPLAAQVITPATLSMNAVVLSANRTSTTINLDGRSRVSVHVKTAQVGGAIDHVGTFTVLGHDVDTVADAVTLATPQLPITAAALVTSGFEFVTAWKYIWIKYVDGAAGASDDTATVMVGVKN